MRGRNCLFLYAAIVACLAPLMLLRGLTPDNEARYLLIADEALARGHWFAFTLHGVAYADKPPLYFWLLMAVKSFFGSCPVWLLSLLSLVPALGVAWLTCRWAGRGTGRFPFAGATLCMMTAGYYAGAALVVRMDMLMCLFMTSALLVFYNICTAAPGWRLRSRQWIIGLLLFAAVFTKGPLGLLLPLCVMLAFLAIEGRLREAGRLLGFRVWLPVVALCALWFAAVWREGGPDYLSNLLFHQTVGRAVNSFHHAHPPYFYLYALLYSLAPWAPVLFASIALGAKDWWRESGPGGTLARYFLTAAVVPVVVLSAISSKLEIYALPAFPFIVALGMLGVARRPGSPLLRCLAALPAAVLTAVLPALLIVPHTPLAPMTDPQWLRLAATPPALAAATTLTAAGAAALWMLARSRRTVEAISLQSAAMLAAIGLLALTLAY